MECTWGSSLRRYFESIRIQKNPDIKMTYNDAVFNRALTMIEDCVLTMGGSHLKNTRSSWTTKRWLLRTCKWICNGGSISFCTTRRIRTRKWAKLNIAPKEHIERNYHCCFQYETEKTFLQNLPLPKRMSILAAVSTGFALTPPSGGRNYSFTIETTRNYANWDRNLILSDLRN